MKSLQIFLLALIIIGLGLLATQKFWVPPFVNWILTTEHNVPTTSPVSTVVPTPAVTTATTTTTVTTHPKPPSPTPTPSATGTVLVSVTLSPTCPVERTPPDPQCAPKPYVSTIKVTRSGSTNVVATGQTTSDGKITFNLPVGTYVVQATGGNVYPRCAPVTAQVVKGETASAAISCDTGIR